MYAPAAIVYHHHSATAGHASAFKHFHVGLNRMRLLAKNAESRHLSRYVVPIAAYELAYLAYACVADRTLAPLRGRALGLRQWSSYRRTGTGRRPVDLAPARGLRAALRRRTAWTADDKPPTADASWLLRRLRRRGHDLSVAARLRTEREAAGRHRQD